jgi:hypothetical protein
MILIHPSYNQRVLGFFFFKKKKLEEAPRNVGLGVWGVAESYLISIYLNRNDIFTFFVYLFFKLTIKSVRFTSESYGSNN